MFKNILIPTDGSDFSEKVVGPAVDMAQAMHAKITAVHVFPRHHISPYGEFGPSDDLVEAQMRERATAEGAGYLDRIEAAAKSAGVACERAIVEEDDAWKAVIETAEAKGCDLIVMATHDRHGLPGLVLGSDTHKVLTHTSIPVLVYH